MQNERTRYIYDMNEVGSDTVASEATVKGAVLFVNVARKCVLRIDVTREFDMVTGRRLFEYRRVH